MIIEHDYLYLEKKFTKERIEKRIEHLYKRALAFIEFKDLIGKVGVNEEILRIVVIDYFADIDRLKGFNPDLERTNLHKIYAYTSYWWLRRKPIQILDNNLNDENLVYINEEFISSYLLHEMNEINKLNKYGKILDISPRNTLEKEFLDNLKYYLIYRVKDAYSIEFFLETFELSLALFKRQESVELEAEMVVQEATAI